MYFQILLTFTPLCGKLWLNILIMCPRLGVYVKICVREYKMGIHGVFSVI